MYSLLPRPALYATELQKRIVNNARAHATRRWPATDVDTSRASLINSQPLKADGVGYFLQVTDIHFDSQYKVRA